MYLISKDTFPLAKLLSQSGTKLLISQHTLKARNITVATYVKGLSPNMKPTPESQGTSLSWLLTR